MLKGTICYTMKYIPGKMHMFCAINTYANLAKILKEKNVPILFIFIIIINIIASILMLI